MATINKNGTYMALPMAIQRGNPIPLDTTAVWYDQTQMETYAQTSPTAYVGQILSLVNEESNTAKAYIIADEAGTLIEVGSATMVDNKTLVLGSSGALALKNWGVKYYAYVEGEDGAPGTYTEQIVDGEHPWLAGLEPKSVSGGDGTFELAWYQPSTTTIEGVSSIVSSLQTTVDGITSALGDADTPDTIRGDIAALETGKLDKSGGVLTGELTLSDGSKAASENVVDTKVAAAVASAGHLKRSIVEDLPEADSADADTIYMVKDDSVSSGDAYNEYMLIDGELAQIGSTSVDLSNYATTSALTAHTGNSEIHVSAGEKAAWNAKVDAEADKSLVSDTLITKLEALPAITSIGANLTLQEGVLAATIPVATTSAAGAVKPDGTTITVTGDGTISVPAASGSAAGLMSSTDYTKLQNAVTGALIGTDSASVSGGNITVPVSSATAYGVVKGSADQDKVAVAADGTMSVNAYSVSKLYVPEGDTLILNCGDSSSL